MEKKVCFIGHRNIQTTDAIREKIRKTVEQLINNENVTFFLPVGHPRGRIGKHITSVTHKTLEKRFMGDWYQ